MANWTASLDKPVAVEPPNAVAYVTWTSDDAKPRSIVGVRVPYAAEVDLLSYLGREAKRLSDVDDRNAQMADVVATATIVPGPIALPDITKLLTLQDAQKALQTKLNVALSQKQIVDATAIDPTVADAVAAVEAAKV